MNKKQITFLLVIMMTLSFFIGFTAGLSFSIITENEVEHIDPVEKAIDYQGNISREICTPPDISRYFPPEEIPIIVDAGRRNNLNFEQIVILFAIRKAEGGGPGKEFGIMSPVAWNTDLDTQARWAAATIFKNQKRWEQAGDPGDFIDFLGNVYCPTTGDLSENEKKLNRHWIPNVKYWIKKIKAIR